MDEKEEKQEQIPESKGDWKQEVVLTIRDMVGLLIILLTVFLLVFRLVVVSGSSMYDTLLDGDYLILLSNTFYNNPEAGDIIVVSKDSFDEGTPIIKRVIATEGQSVDIDFAAGVVYVDGKALEEPYTHTPTNMQEGMRFPLTVEEDCVFALGDNRNNSRDSRDPSIGQVDKREILGKAIFLALPAADKERNEINRDFSRIGAIQ